MGDDIKRNETDSERKKIEDEIKRKGCPAIANALPPWPSELKDNAEWIGLHKDGFSSSSYFNYIAETGKTKSSKEETPSNSQSGEQSKTDDMFKVKGDEGFCLPLNEYSQLLSIFKNHKGGSFLVTGYRGTGKSRLVNYTIDKLIEKEKLKKKQENDSPNDETSPINYVPIRVNLSTYRTAMALVMMMIKGLYIAYNDDIFKDLEEDDKNKISNM